MAKLSTHFPFFIFQILENFHCIPEEAGGARFLEIAPYIQCTIDTSTSPYLLELLLPSVFFGIVYIIGFPVLLWFLMYRNRNRMHSPEIETMLGFVYENFKHKFWWFEILLIVRRVFIVTILSVAPRIFAEESALLILSFFLFLFLFLHPYQERDEVNSEIVSTTSILILLTTGVFHENNYLNGSSSYSWLNWLGLSIYLLTLLYLLGELLYPQLAKTTIWRMLNCKTSENAGYALVDEQVASEEHSMRDMSNLVHPEIIDNE